MRRITASLFLFLLIIYSAWAHQPVIVEKEPIEINNPEISRAFYDTLPGKPRLYLINSNKDFELYVNLLVPKNTNLNGRYSARVYKLNKQESKLLKEINGNAVPWKEFFEPFGRDTYLKGPEFRDKLPAGIYQIEVFNADNQGKYVLAVGEKESFGPKEIAQVYWVIPKLKLNFFHSSIWSFFITPFGIVLIFGAAILVLIIFFLTARFR